MKYNVKRESKHRRILLYILIHIKELCTNSNMTYQKSKIVTHYKFNASKPVHQIITRKGFFLSNFMHTTLPCQLCRTSEEKYHKWKAILKGVYIKKLQVYALQQDIP